MSDTDRWPELRARLTAAEERRDYECCALLAIEASDMVAVVVDDDNIGAAIAASQTWVAQAQVYATLSLTRQMELRAEREEFSR